MAALFLSDSFTRRYLPSLTTGFQGVLKFTADGAPLVLPNVDNSAHVWEGEAPAEPEIMEKNKAAHQEVRTPGVCLPGFVLSESPCWQAATNSSVHDIGITAPLLLLSREAVYVTLRQTLNTSECDFDESFSYRD